MSISQVQICQYCTRPAVYYRRISNEFVCAQHFIETIEHKIRRTVRKYMLFSLDEKVVVGVSGGKDSITVLYNVVQIQKKNPYAMPVEAILIDEGIQGYREESIRITQKLCAEWEIPLHIVRFDAEFGKQIDDLIPRLKDEKVNPCNICGTVRRHLLNEWAVKLKADKLVIGHNLDDQVETFLQNILRNDIKQMQQHPPSKNPEDPLGCFIPRVKPLMNIPENEITLYCYYKGFPIQSIPCPYVQDFYILRRQVQKFLNDLEYHSPEIKYNLLVLNERLIEIISHFSLISKSEVSAKKCIICGGTTGEKRELCLYCEFKKKFST